MWAVRVQGVDLARKMEEGVVGKPRRDPATGWLADQSLPHTDIGFVKARAPLLEKLMGCMYCTVYCTCTVLYCRITDSITTTN